MRSFAEIRTRFAGMIATGNHGSGAIDPGRAPVRHRAPAPSFLDDTVRTASLDTGEMPRIRTLDANPLDSAERAGPDSDALSYPRLGHNNPNGIDPDTLMELGRDRGRPAGPSPRYARLAYLMLAQLGG